MFQQRQYIAEATNIFKHANLKVDVHALGTNVGTLYNIGFKNPNKFLEGPMDAVLVAVKHVRQRCHDLGAPKVDMHVNISSRREPCSLEERKQKVLNQKM